MTETVNVLASKREGWVFRRKPSPAARAQAIFTASSGLARTIFGSSFVTSIIWSIELALKNFHNEPELRQFNGRCVTDQVSAGNRQCEMRDLIDEIMIELPKIILASASPRRAEILRTVGWPFETLAVDIDESRREGEDATDYVQRFALEKAEAAAAQLSDLT